MPTRQSRALHLAAAALTATLAGCAASHLAASAPPGAGVNGDWKLDSAGSDDVAMAVANLQAQIRKADHRPRQAPNGGFNGMRRMRPPGEGREEGHESQEGAEGQSSENVPAPAPGAALVQELLSHVPAGDYLRITFGPGEFTVATGQATWQYAPGVQTAVEIGEVAAEQTCGWKGHQFIIVTQPQWGPTLTDTYGLAPDGKLTMTLHLRGGGIDVSLTRRYARTTEAPPPAVPTSD